MIFTAAKSIRVESALERRGITLRRAGQELFGPCPRCGGRDRFAVNVRKQVFNCRGCRARGDVVDLVRHLDGVSFAEAIRTLTGTSTRPASPPSPTPPAPKDNDEYEQRQRAKARWLWAQRQPIAGTIAERYLRDVRHYSGPLPATLGFLPARKPDQHPAMIAAFGLVDEPEPGIVGKPHDVISVHLTLLRPDGSDKADVTPNKIIIASPAGMPIVVAPLNDLLGLAITEGVEDALSVYEASGLGVWAAGSAPHMAKLAAAVARAKPDCVTVFVDDDQAGRDSARKLAIELCKFTQVLLREAKP